MKPNLFLTVFTVLALGACAPAGQEGDACTSADDCEEGLECHVEEHDDHTDEEGGEEEEHEEEGVCESHDEHDH